MEIISESKISSIVLGVIGVGLVTELYISKWMVYIITGEHGAILCISLVRERERGRELL